MVAIFILKIREPLMRKKVVIAAACAVVLAVSGCAKFGKKGKPSGEYHASHQSNQANQDIAYQGGVEENTRFFDGEDSVYSQEELLAKRIFRFGYDRYDVSGQDFDSLYAHANYLQKNPNKRIRIEGHTDERGSREYNIGLGERRAKAISNVFLSKGVGANQFSIVSYGEEKPEIHGSSEQNYQLNRRAVIVYEE
jgi:peptidoglycan-associated lipoprotein